MDPRNGRDQSRASNKALAAALLLTALALAGCAAEQASIRPHGGTHATPQGDMVRCNFQLDALEDARPTQDLGTLGRTRIDGEQFLPWLRKALAGGEGTPVRLRVTLARAHIQTVSTMKSANIVVRVQGTGGGTRLDKVYRGVHSSVNWSNSEAEVQEAFDGAAADLRRQIVEDLPALCAAS